MELIWKVALVLIVGYIGGRLARLLKLPDVSGYLFLGIFLGPSLGIIFRGFNGIITPDDQITLTFISELALGFIAFSIGSEFNYKQIKKLGKTVTIITVFEVLFAVLGVFLILFFIPKPNTIMKNGYEPFCKENISFGLILASMSAATAPAATLLVMRQYKAYGSVTKTLLPVTALDDIFGIIIFGFNFSVAQILLQKPDQHIALLIAKPFIEVAGSVLLGIIIGFIVSFINNRLKKSFNDLQVVSLCSILLTIGIIWLINKELKEFGISFSSLLSCITIGTIIANFVRKPDYTFESVNNLTTPFFILFFTLAGASLDLKILGQSGLIIALCIAYIIARGVGKYLGAYTGAKISKADDNVKNYLGLALLLQGGVSLGLLVIIRNILKDQEIVSLIATIIMVSILIYETTGPIFAKIAITKSGEVNGLEKLDMLSSIDDIELEKETESK